MTVRPLFLAIGMLLAVPAFALSPVRDDTPRKISGAGLVLVVSLQQRNG